MWNQVACGLVWTGLLVGSAACTSVEARPSMAPEAATEGAACPMAVPGARLAVTDTPAGIALTFTTTSDRVEELRSNVRRLAEMHGVAGGPGMMGGRRMMHGPGRMVPSQVAVEDLPDGARMVLTPLSPGDLERLRAQTRGHAEALAAGNCGMNMMTGDARAPGPVAPGRR